MRVSNNESAALTMAKIAGAVHQEGQNLAKQEGKAVIDLIDNSIGPNQPLSEGDIGRTINVKV